VDVRTAASERATKRSFVRCLGARRHLLGDRDHDHSGYGDKTPNTPVGRYLAMLWIIMSLVLISLLSTSLVSRMTAARFSDLDGKRLAAEADSSGAEYLDSHGLKYTKYADLPAALTSLVNGRSDAVVNSVGALEYLISKRFPDTISMPRGLLAPSYMAFALPLYSPLKKPLDRALVTITATSDWRSFEESYFGSTE
jgi:ABC-type amino acid transport substrate-binding protein